MQTLNDLLDLAIEDEIKAQKLYQDAHDRFDDKESKRFMKKLVEEEKKHETTLKEIKTLAVYDGSVELDAGSKSLQDQPIHSSDKEISESSSMEEILEIALQREYKAQKVYKKMAVFASNQELKTLFSKLAAEEENHHKSIAKKFSLQRGEMGMEM